MFFESAGSRTRRRFLGSLGAAGASAALLHRFGGGVARAEEGVIVDPGLDNESISAALIVPPLDIARFRDLCLRTAKSNVVDGRPIPSAAYPQGTWMRDAYWTMQALGDRDLKRRTWQRFAAKQERATGRVPSAVLNTGEVYYAAEDESTALFVLLALDLQRAGTAVERPPLEAAARYLASRTETDGRVLSGPGPFTWWNDTLILAQRDVVAYTQGVWAVALRALVELKLIFPLDRLFRAEDSYRALYRADLGTMTMSRSTTLLDVSCLVGEHLSQHNFGLKILPDETVRRTLSTFRRVTYPDGAFLGFPVLSMLDGQYCPEAWFHPAPDNWPGFYHNGGSWLLYDAIALDVGRKHGVAEAEDLFRARLHAETRVKESLNEYIVTNPARGTLGSVPFPWRAEYAWNAYVATLL